MGFFDDIFDFFFGWLIPDVEDPGFKGTEVTLQKPNKANIVYGNCKNVRGTIVRSELKDAPGGDIPNAFLYVHVNWSVHQIESIDQIYFNEISIDDSKWDGGNGENRFVYAYHSPNGGTITLTAVDGEQLIFRGYGNAFSVIRLEIHPDGFTGFPNITADLHGIKAVRVDTLTQEYTDNYADIIYDYLLQHYGRGLIDLSLVDRDSFIAERAYTETLVQTNDASSTTQKLMSCNVVLDGNARVKDNLAILLKGCRGFLPYTTDGKYKLIIEHERTPLSTVITDDDRMSDIVISDTDINEHYNSVTVTYRDKDSMGKEAKVTFPDEPGPFIAEDNGIALPFNITIETINNRYEALQMAELIFNRSRNAGKLKISTKSAFRNVSVGSVIPITSSSFEIVEKPYIVNSVIKKLSGITEFECVEYQENIYPWVVRPAATIPDTTVPDFSTVTAVTSATVDYEYTNVSQAVVSWSSSNSRFSLRLINPDSSTSNLGVTANKSFNLDGLEVGNYQIGIVAINGLNYRSSEVLVDVDITQITTPLLLDVPVGDFLYVEPAKPSGDYAYTYEFYYGTVDTGLEPDAQVLTRGPDGFFLDVKEGISLDTTYYIYYRISTRLIKGNWVKASAVSGTGIPVSSLGPDVIQTLTDLQLDIDTNNTNFEVLIEDTLLQALQDVQDRNEFDFLTAEYVNEINGFRLEINETVGQVLVEGGIVTAEEFNAYRLLVDTHEATLISQAQQIVTINGVTSTNTTQIAQNTSDISFILSNLDIGDINGQFNSLNLRLDGTENSIEQQALSVNFANFEILDSILNETLDKNELLNQGISLATIQTSVTAITAENEAFAQQLTEIATIAGDGFTVASLATTAISNEAQQRITQENIFISRFESNEADIVQNTTAITTESQARASDVSTLTASIDGVNSTLTATVSRVDQAEVDINGNASAIAGVSATVTTVSGTATSALNLASSNESAITGLTSTVNTVSGTATSALNLATSVDNRTNNLATFALETDVNGFTSGIYNQNDGTTADFRIRTNNFEIVDSSTDEVVLKRNISTGTWEFTGGGDFTGKVTASEGEIAGWKIQAGVLKSSDSGSRIELNATKNRVSIFNSTDEKVVMGYLDGLPKNDGTGNWDVNDYGFWVLDGEKLVIDGDTEYVDGDWLVTGDANVRIITSQGWDAVRLGSVSTARGLFIYDGTSSQNVVAQFTNQGISINGDNGSLTFSDGDLEYSGTLSGADGTFTGTLSAATILGGTISGSTITAPSISGGTISGVDGTFEGTVSGGTVSGSVVEIIRGGKRLRIDPGRDTMLWFGDESVSVASHNSTNGDFIVGKSGKTYHNSGGVFTGTVYAENLEGDIYEALNFSSYTNRVWSNSSTTKLEIANVTLTSSNFNRRMVIQSFGIKNYSRRTFRISVEVNGSPLTIGNTDYSASEITPSIRLSQQITPSMNGQVMRVYIQPVTTEAVNNTDNEISFGFSNFSGIVFSLNKI